MDNKLCYFIVEISLRFKFIKLANFLLKKRFQSNECCDNRGMLQSSVKLTK